MDLISRISQHFTDSADTINLFNYGAPLAMVVFFIIFVS